MNAVLMFWEDLNVIIKVKRQSICGGRMEKELMDDPMSGVIV